MDKPIADSKPLAAFVFNHEGEQYVLRQDYERLRAMLTWISVEDRLPEKHTAVLVYTDMHGNHAASFDGEEWFCDYGGEWLFPNVTHWMPLPEPPEVT
jgi:hypothetical protein